MNADKEKNAKAAKR